MRFKPKHSVKLAISLGTAPPKEFRIFRRGWNDTYKGKFLFDEEAASEVMAAYKEHNVDRPIDLEHLSIDPDAPNYDPDARAWFKLDVRDGELWAYDIRWTPDGERRLKEGTQRYFSPYFGFDKETKRVQCLYNMAICAIPATKDIPALIAASVRSKLALAALSIEAEDMDKKQICAALGLGEDASGEDILGAIKAFQEEDGKGKEQAASLRKMLKLADDAPYEDVEAALKKLTGADDEESDDGEEKEEKKVEAADDGDGDEDDKEEKEMAKLSPKLKGMFLGMKASIDTLTKQVGSLSKKQAKNEVEELIASNTDKVPLHMEAFLKKQPVEVVQEFLKHSIATPRPKAQPKQESHDTAALKLTKEEKEIAKLSNISEENALKFKKERVEKDRQRAGQQAD